jgi:hypothetical protein
MSKNGVTENVFSTTLAQTEGGCDKAVPFDPKNVIIRSLDGARCPNAFLRILDLDMICCIKNDVKQPNGFFIPQTYEGWPCVMYGHYIKCYRTLKDRESDSFRNGSGPLWVEALTGFAYLRELADVMRTLPRIGSQFDSNSWFQGETRPHIHGMNPGGWHCFVDLIVSMWDDNYATGIALKEEEALHEARVLDEIVEVDRMTIDGSIPKQDTMLMTRCKRRAVARVLSAMFTAIQMFDDMNEIDPEIGRVVYPQKNRVEFMWETMTVTNVDKEKRTTRDSMELSRKTST